MRTKLNIDGYEVLVPTAMFNALIGDAEATGFLNLDAAETLAYELLEWETGDYANALDMDEWVRFLETAERV